MSEPEDLPADELGGQPVLTISTRRDDTTVVLALTGELDLHGAESLHAEVLDVLATDAVEALDMDLRDLVFIDSAGLQAVLTARQTVEDGGATFRIVEISPAVRRMVEITGLGNALSTPREDPNDPPR